MEEIRRFISPQAQQHYQQYYQQSLSDPLNFWQQQAEKYLTWNRRWDTVLIGNFASQNARWFSGATLNASFNCLDRHLTSQANKIAIIWEGDEPHQTRTITYQELHTEVCRLANALKALNITQGDRICIYLPMIPEAVIAMLACARIGAVHSVVFSGFSPDALKSRILDAECKLVMTADASQRGGKLYPLKESVDYIINDCPSVQHIIVIKSVNHPIAWSRNNYWYHELLANADTHCPAPAHAATDPLFILYTSGSTGKPKGILHGTGGYLLYATMTFDHVFNYQENDIFWCTADVGWITGHSYLVYGPLARGATVVMFAGIPTYPTASRYWEIIDKHRVTIFYTAPTALRTLIRFGDEAVKATHRNSLRLLGSVGEPINPEVWMWYYRVVGEERCPIVDTWWQTETGGIMITALPHTMPLKPGSASQPFYGIAADIVDDNGNPVTANTPGNLVITQPWPGQLQTIYGDHQRFINSYFSNTTMYLTGDGAVCDDDHYFWIKGRLDDVINVSGHRLGTAEIESALVAHPDVAEAAVVGCPHPIKGQGIYAFVTLKKGVSPNQNLQIAISDTVSKEISAIAKPDYIQWSEELPKTRSGKIMRRLLRRIVNGEIDELGDTSTLSNPEILSTLIANIKISPKQES